jgi:beta-galactosidase
LLKYPDIKLRTTEDKRFMDAQEKYLKAVAEVLRPHFLKNGGPIIMIQIENEYGSYHRKGRKYMQWLKDFWTRVGFSPLSSSDGAGTGYLRHVVLPGVAVGLDPGTKEQHWQLAHKLNPGVPVFSGETYPGWLRHWGEGNWRPKNIDKLVAWYMETGKSFNLYVFNGGTNFRLTAGANDCRNVYKADVTSYDYGCPVGEAGNMTPAYFSLRKVIGGFLTKNGPLPKPPPQPETMDIAKFKPVRVAGLRNLFPKPVAVDSKAMWLEALGQNQGLARYVTELPPGPAAKLTFENLHDYGHIYLDGKLLKTYTRSNNDEKSVDIPARQKKALLEVVVEAMGHINFKYKMETDRKGFYGTVKLGDTPIKNWKIARLPLDGKEIEKFLHKKTEAPPKPNAEYKGSLFTAVVTINGQPHDTFLDMTKYEKGYVWVNGRLLGRYWKIGPQERLYCPAVWLRTGKNVINVLDMNVNDARYVRGCKTRNFTVRKRTKNADNAW